MNKSLVFTRDAQAHNEERTQVADTHTYTYIQQEEEEAREKVRERERHTGLNLEFCSAFDWCKQGKIPSNCTTSGSLAPLFFKRDFVESSKGTQRERERERERESERVKAFVFTISPLNCVL